MILKYETNGSWEFIDNVRQAAHKDIDIDGLAEKYDPELHICSRGYNDQAEYLNGDKLPENIVKSNKAFCVATYIPEEGINLHSENLLDENKMDMPASSILLYLENCKEYDAVQLVTNQKAYLMNDKGQTIERLN